MLFRSPEIPDLSKTVPVRPPGFCTGCPERPIFAAMKLVEAELGAHQITGDIGCHLFAALPPFEIGGSTMGYGLGAAIGAQVASPKKRVVHVTGDGSFRMNLNEMATTARYNLPVITVLLDNHTLGMVRQWQTLFFDKRHAETTLPALNFCAIAEGFGYFAQQVSDAAGFDAALQKALEHGGPSLIHCLIDTEIGRAS